MDSPRIALFPNTIKPDVTLTLVIVVIKLLSTMVFCLHNWKSQVEGREKEKVGENRTLGALLASSRRRQKQRKEKTNNKDVESEKKLRQIGEKYEVLIRFHSALATS